MQEMTHRITTELRRLYNENHDSCVMCNYTFISNDTAHLGYSDKGIPLYVCDRCSRNLKETAVRYLFSPLPYKTPLVPSVLWRYMDFTKYVSLLSSKSLYFTRSDRFKDIFEGAKGLKKNKVSWDEHHLKFFRSAIQNPPGGIILKTEVNNVTSAAEKLISDLNHIGELSRKRNFVNCWHENELESEAMWRLYSSYIENAVAIKTSYQHLYESLGCNNLIKIGHIEYVDLSTGYNGVNNAFWRKRKSFEHEREVRAVIQDFDCNDLGKIIPCDLQILIKEVYVSPEAQPWFIDLIKDVNKKYSLDVNVTQSSLNEEPFY